MLYAIVHYFSFAVEDDRINVKDSAGDAEVALLNEVNDGDYIGAEARNEGQAESSFNEERRWPPGLKLVPNWIVQLVFPPILWFIRLIGYDGYRKSGWLYVTFHSSSSSLNGILANMLSSWHIVVMR